MAELGPSFYMPGCCLYNARQPQTLRQNPQNQALGELRPALIVQVEFATKTKYFP